MALVFAALNGSLLRGAGSDSAVAAERRQGESTGEQPAHPKTARTLPKPLPSDIPNVAKPVDLPIPAKILRYSRRLVKKYDGNGNSRLEKEKDEWAKMRGDPRLADANNDSVITVHELAQYVANYGGRRRIRLLSPELTVRVESAEPAQADPPAGSIDGTPEAAPGEETKSMTSRSSTQDARRRLKYFVPAARLPQGLPQWFLDRDRDGDGQLTLSEYTPKTAAADVTAFAKYDTNRDGLLTPKEYLRAVKASSRPKP